MLARLPLTGAERCDVVELVVVRSWTATLSVGWTSQSRLLEDRSKTWLNKREVTDFSIYPVHLHDLDLVNGGDSRVVSTKVNRRGAQRTGKT